MVFGEREKKERKGRRGREREREREETVAVAEEHPQKLQHFWLAFLEGLKFAVFEDESLTCSNTGKACSLQSTFLYHTNEIKAKALLSLPFSHFLFSFLFAEQFCNSRNIVYSRIISRVVVEMIHTKCCFNEL